MLDPAYRQVYLDELKPPAGFCLDHAVATTFSLDLMSLLMAPISMTLQGHDCSGGPKGDPILFLEALRRAAGRFVVFCQQGHVAVPNHDTLLYSYLESAVVEVKAFHPQGVFHPKTWLLRFKNVEDEESIMYRFLCLSRNLTFDRSWDTVLTLEGNLASGRKRGFAENRPLSHFIRTLPMLAQSGLAPDARDFVFEMAEEVNRVVFHPPTGFDPHIQFIPTGIPDYGRFPKPKNPKRVLIMSPFVSPGMLQDLLVNGRGNVVISRGDSLDEINVKTLDKLSEGCEFYVMDTGSETPEELDEESSAVQARLEDQSGLHAKLMITENGGGASLYSGSANATNAGFNGRNVEFVVRLSGPRRAIGIDAFLGNEESKIAFRNLLQTYKLVSEITIDTDQKVLEDLLEKARKSIAGAGLSISIKSETGESYTVSLLSTSPLTAPVPPVKGECFPLAMAPTSAKSLERLKGDGAIVFDGLSLKALSSFMVFRLTAQSKGKLASIAFVLNLPVSGMPADRDRSILHGLLSDKGAFMRYLMLILHGEEDEAQPYPGGNVKGQGSNGGGTNSFGFPLLEEMIRAFSRDGDRVKRIARLVAELKESGVKEDFFPAGFEQIWAAFLEAQEKE